MEDRKGFCRKTAAEGTRAGCKDPVLWLGDAPAMLVYTPRSTRAGGPGWVAAPRPQPGTHSLWLPLLSPAWSSRKRGARACTGLEALFGMAARPRACLKPSRGTGVGAPTPPRGDAASGAPAQGWKRQWLKKKQGLSCQDDLLSH